MDHGIENAWEATELGHTTCNEEEYGGVVQLAHLHSCLCTPCRPAMSPLLLGSCTHQLISASFAPRQAGRTVKAAGHGHLRRRVMVECSAEDKTQLDSSA